MPYATSARSARPGIESGGLAGWVCVLAISGAMFFSFPTFGQSYWVEDTGIVSELGVGTSFQMNNAGVLVGRTDRRACMWVRGAIRMLPDYGRASGANAINDSGVIVGWAELPSGAKHAVVFGDQGPLDLGVPSGGADSFSEATSISEIGEIGLHTYNRYHVPPYGSANGYLRRTDGTMVSMRSLTGGSIQIISGVNTRGEIAGRFAQAGNYGYWGFFIRRLAGWLICRSCGREEPCTRKI